MSSDIGKPNPSHNFLDSQESLISDILAIKDQAVAKSEQTLSEGTIPPNPEAIQKISSEFRENLIKNIKNSPLPDYLNISFSLFSQNNEAWIDEILKKNSEKLKTNSHNKSSIQNREKETHAPAKANPKAQTSEEKTEPTAKTQEKKSTENSGSSSSTTTKLILGGVGVFATAYFAKLYIGRTIVGMGAKAVIQQGLKASFKKAATGTALATLAGGTAGATSQSTALATLIQGGGTSLLKVWTGASLPSLAASLGSGLLVHYGSQGLTDGFAKLWNSMLELWNGNNLPATTEPSSSDPIKNEAEPKPEEPEKRKSYDEILNEFKHKVIDLAFGTRPSDLRYHVGIELQSALMQKFPPTAYDDSISLPHMEAQLEEIYNQLRSMRSLEHVEPMVRQQSKLRPLRINILLSSLSKSLTSHESLSSILHQHYLSIADTWDSFSFIFDGTEWRGRLKPRTRSTMAELFNHMAIDYNFAKQVEAYFRHSGELNFAIHLYRQLSGESSGAYKPLHPSFDRVQGQSALNPFAQALFYALNNMEEEATPEEVRIDWITGFCFHAGLIDPGVSRDFLQTSIASTYNKLMEKIKTQDKDQILQAIVAMGDEYHKHSLSLTLSQRFHVYKNANKISQKETLKKIRDSEYTRLYVSHYYNPRARALLEEHLNEAAEKLPEVRGRGISYYDSNNNRSLLDAGPFNFRPKAIQEDQFFRLFYQEVPTQALRELKE